MKKNIIKTAIAGLALAAVVTGCYNPSNLADTKDELQKKAATIATGVAGGAETVAGIGASSLSATGSLVAGADYKTVNALTITITANDAVTKDVVKEAVVVYGLKDNATNKYYPMALDAAQTYEIVDYTVSKNASDKIVTTVIADVKLAAYKNNKVAVKFDATKLKDAQGTLLLNGNGNETLGEETDSEIRVLTLTAASGATLTTLNGQAPVVKNKQTLNITGVVEYAKDDAKKIEGIKFTVIAPPKSYTEAMVVTYDESLAATYNSIYKVQTIAPGANAWTDVALSFSYDKDAKNYKALLPISAIPVGTQYRTVTKIDPAVSVANDIYGMPYVMTYSKKVTYTTSNDSTSGYYNKGTTVIVGANAADTNVFTGNATTAQKAKLTVAAGNGTSITKDGKGARFEVTFVDEMAAYNDIVIALDKTDFNKKKVPSQIIVLEKATTDGHVTKIAVETTDNTYATADLSLYVGPGCTLKTAVNTNQTTFGTGYADWSAGELSGYVKLN